MENIIKATEAPPAEYREAMELHTQIMTNGKIAAAAMVEFARGLKRMRDERLYVALGIETFDKYVDDVVGIGQRQAYTYIRALEQLGAPMMEEHAAMGITKLEILSQVYAVDREAFLEENNVAEMSAKEMRELVAKLKDTGEQLSFIQEENERLKAELEEKPEEVVADFAGTIERQATYISELEQELAAAQAAAEESAVSEEALEEAREDARRKALTAAEREKKAAVDAAKKQEADKAKKAVADAKAAQKKAEDALKEAKQQAEERLQKITAAAEAEKEGQARRAAELERRLKIAANPNTTAVAVYVDEMSGLLRKALAKIKDVKASDEETGAKLAKAMLGVMDAVRPRFEELYMEVSAT